ncbi:precorrin-2 dehydrogenase/sirohydrochlorin ferrochelatase family protein [Stomatohabitans albus]
MLDLSGTPVWCVGGGEMAAAKVGPMIDAGAQVTLISPEVHELLQERVAEIIPREYQTGDIKPSNQPALVVAASDVREVNAQVKADADALGLWCLRIDQAGDMSLPARVPVDDLTVAVATGVPALTARLSAHLAHDIDPKWAEAAEVLRELRRDVDVRKALSALPQSERAANWRLTVDAALDGENDRFALLRILTGLEY